jgi:hypothetical protein
VDFLVNICLGTSFFDVQLSMYHMAVLLLFNQSLNWTVKRIEAETKIKPDLLMQTLCVLLKHRLLACEQLSGSNFTKVDIKLDYDIQLATSFTW